jgi:hypothetical protein
MRAKAKRQRAKAGPTVKPENAMAAVVVVVGAVAVVVAGRKKMAKRGTNVPPEARMGATHPPQKQAIRRTLTSKSRAAAPARQRLLRRQRRSTRQR